MGFVAAIQELIKSIDRGSEINFNFVNNVYDSIHLDKKVEINLYRIVQEALNNILKHSNASEAIIQLFYSDPGELRLFIEDNGIGFNAESELKNSTYGFNSLKNRAMIINAHLEIDSHPGKGTILSLEMKLDNDLSKVPVKSEQNKELLRKKKTYSLKKHYIR